MSAPLPTAVYGVSLLMPAIAYYGAADGYSPGNGANSALQKRSAPI